jgi:hypothetical protein
VTENLAKVLFGPRPRRGVVLGLRVPQLAVLVAGGAVATALLGRGPAGSLAALVVAVTAAGVALLPIGGRHGDEWLPVLARYATRPRTARRRVGAPPGGAAVLEVPGARLELTAVEVAGGRRVGVVVDSRRRTVTAVAALRGAGSLALLEPGEQWRRGQGFAALLAALGRDGAAVLQVQWVHRTRPMPTVELDRVAAPVAPSRWAAADASYRGLLDTVGGELVRHDMFLTVTVRGRAGDLDPLLRELATVQDSADAAGITVTGWLPPRLLGAAVRTGYDPGAVAVVAARDDDPDTAGVHPGVAGPAATQEGWRWFACDGAVHATYWVAEWPRVPVAVDFLAPLLVELRCAHTVAVVAQPLSSRAAQRATRAARATDLADADLRARLGQLDGARDDAQADAADQLDADLAAGHTLFRFHGLLTVTAPTPDALAAGCAEVEQAAARAHLDLRRLYGQQAEAFTWTLPVGVGP